MPKRRITADGDVVIDDGTTGSSGSSVENFFNGSNSDRLDVFGFSLEKKQCLMLLLACLIILGPRSTFGVLMACGLYRAWSATANHSSLPQQSSSSSSSTSNNNNRTSWSSRVSSGGSNIRGVSDLPCDPRRG